MSSGNFGLPPSTRLPPEYKMELLSWPQFNDACFRNKASPIVAPEPIELNARRVNELRCVNAWVDRTMVEQSDFTHPRLTYSNYRYTRRSGPSRVIFKKWGYEERWGYTAGSFAGECDDRAFFKRELLIHQFRWPLSSVHPVAVEPPPDPEYPEDLDHAIIVATTDRGDYILDGSGGIYGLYCPKANTYRYLP